MNVFEELINDFGLITEKRHNKIVGELIKDHTSTVESIVRIGDDLNAQLAFSRQDNDMLRRANKDFQCKVHDYQSNYQYGLANHRITLNFYYGHLNSFSCRVTFTPNLCDVTAGSPGLQKRFGWGNDGAPIDNELEVIEQIFKEIPFHNWHWSTTEKKPAAWFGNHDIAAITEAVGKFNGELQKQVNNILKAEQYLRIARATVPECNPEGAC